MDHLTNDQVDAITHAWLDLSATNDMMNGNDPIDKWKWLEIAEAAKDSVAELEKAFPFLLDIEDE